MLTLFARTLAIGVFGAHFHIQITPGVCESKSLIWSVTSQTAQFLYVGYRPDSRCVIVGCWGRKFNCHSKQKLAVHDTCEPKKFIIDMAYLFLFFRSWWIDWSQKPKFLLSNIHKHVFLNCSTIQKLQKIQQKNNHKAASSQPAMISQICCKFMLACCGKLTEWEVEM